MRLNQQGKKEDFSERDILYKVLFDMKKDMVELKKLVVDIIQNGDNVSNYAERNPQVINSLYRDIEMPTVNESTLTIQQPVNVNRQDDYRITHDAEEVEESLSLIDKEADMIKRALKKHKGKRKAASEELGISERTLYRKIKELNLS
jgi:transcriptional regulator with PAS, ATPase and Fis domain